MNFNAVLINEINEQFFDFFNNKDEVNELISLNSFTPEKNNFLLNLFKKNPIQVSWLVQASVIYH